MGEHSEKPAIFRDEIVQLCGDLPRLEMFARCTPPGWDVLGNEVTKSVAIAGGEASATQLPIVNDTWPIEVTELVEAALDQCPCEPTDTFYSQLCAQANALRLAGSDRDNAIQSIIQTIKESTQCAA